VIVVHVEDQKGGLRGDIELDLLVHRQPSAAFPVFLLREDARDAFKPLALFFCQCFMEGDITFQIPRRLAREGLSEKLSPAPLFEPMEEHG